MNRERKMHLAIFGVVACLAIACAFEPIDKLLPEADAQWETGGRRTVKTDPPEEPIYSIQKAKVERRIFPPVQVRMEVAPGEHSAMEGTRIVTAALANVTHEYIVVIHAQWLDSGYCEGTEMIHWVDITYAFNYETQEEIVRPVE